MVSGHFQWYPEVSAALYSTGFHSSLLVFSTFQYFLLMCAGLHCSLVVSNGLCWYVLICSAVAELEWCVVGQQCSSVVFVGVCRISNGL